jgi:hypothetical protein
MSADQAATALHSGRLVGIITIPAGFSADVERGTTVVLDVRIDRGVIAVRRSLTIHGESSPKTGRSIRDIEMLPRVREALLEQRRWVTGRFELGSEFVFPNGVGRPLQVHNFSFHVWPRIVKQAGVPYRALKQTRHTFATLMLQHGAPLDWLQRQMGHVMGQLGALQGKILRITPDLALRPNDKLSENGRYRIPSTGPDPNPFISVAGARPEILAYGLRNPHRMDWDPVSNTLLATCMSKIK